MRLPPARRTVLRGGAALGVTALGLTARPPAARAATGTTPLGWPASDNPAAIGITTVAIPHSRLTVSIKAGPTATILTHVASRFAADVQPLTGAGGYNYRTNVNNASVLSEHAAGTAIDLNPAQHPNGASSTFSSSQIATLRAILTECEGTIRWGGDYSGIKDEMHFEILLPPSSPSLASVAAKLAGQDDHIPPPSIEEDDMPVQLPGTPTGAPASEVAIAAGAQSSVKVVAAQPGAHITSVVAMTQPSGSSAVLRVTLGQDFDLPAFHASTQTIPADTNCLVITYTGAPLSVHLF